MELNNNNTSNNNSNNNSNNSNSNRAEWKVLCVVTLEISLICF